MVVNKTYIARYWKPEPKDENNLIAKMLLLFIFGVKFMATEKIVWNTTFYNLDVYNIHQNLAKQYNDRTDLIVNIILLSIGK